MTSNHAVGFSGDLGHGAGLAVCPLHQRTGLGVADEALGGRVDDKLPTHAVGDIAVVAEQRRQVHLLDVGVWSLARADAVEKVGEVAVVELAAMLVRDRAEVAVEYLPAVAVPPEHHPALPAEDLDPGAAERPPGQLVAVADVERGLLLVGGPEGLLEDHRQVVVIPILDGGYSLQYSPLLEYRERKGVVLFCEVDVTGRTERDPGAEALLHNLVQYVSTWDDPYRFFNW